MRSLHTIRAYMFRICHPRQFGFLCLLLLAGSVVVSQSEASCKCVTGTKWLHSYEEDTEGMTVFRPAGYDFPPSRGPREGITLNSDGRFVRYGIGQADAGSTRSGTWKWLQQDTAQLSYSDAEKKYTVLKVVSCTSNKLSLRILNRPK
jgi:hypothetical protein